ncbi:uncharacterized protein LOC124266751 [Haliotis rubra]|uniref:uncharacterized protein LOC124266751 n=1 Tax=Haliotis rubra TaxID=36100 RepID=UPI001EE508C3|nr:uncharacterized protein LOC124266751 [Haliotis rubra]
MVAVILCVLSLVMTLTPTLGGSSTIKGTITGGQVTCSYAEIKKNSGAGPRGLRLFSCKNKDGNMNLDCYYYGGNPHDCAYYNKNQQKYYNLLAKSAMNNGQPCRNGSISERKCDETYPCEKGNCM